MPRLKRSSEDGFNLAFLDVMACGLGAVILIFMLVDFNDITVEPTEEKKALELELAASEQQQVELEKSMDEVNENISMETDTESETENKQQEIQSQLDDVKKAIASKQAIIADLENQKAAVLEKVAKDSTIVKAGTGEQNYIVGMPVSGKQIGILIDKSASMMDIELVSILLADTLPDKEKVAQPKWVRTKNIAKWLLSRLPQQSKVTAVAYSNDAKVLGLRDVMSSSLTASMNSIVKDLGEIVPQGGTNLELALETLLKANPNVDSIYILTDGLPTFGKANGACGKLIGKRKTITAECRAQVGIYALEQFVRSARQRVSINTILLPIEGDPFASSVYWAFTKQTGGKMLSPALEWN